MRSTVKLEDVDFTNIDTWLQTLVNSEEFMQKLQSTIMIDIEKPESKARFMLDLLDYVKPKVKTIDPPSPDERREINITYIVEGKKSE